MLSIMLTFINQKYNNSINLIYQLFKVPIMQVEDSQLKNKVKVRSFNEIEIQPSTINSIYYCQEDNNLYVSREKSTQVYHVLKNVTGELQFQHIARLPWSKYVLKINSILFLFCPFQLRTFQNNSWEINPFTTQLLSIKVKKISDSLIFVYSFHEQETVQYKISRDSDGDEDFTTNFLPKGKMPFHVTKQNIVQGYGKKIGPNHKNTSFTVSQFKHQEYVVVGDSQGSLHIYDFKTLGHLKSFKRHLGPILTIKIDQANDAIFYSGSDSKVVALKKQNNEWLLSGQVRGQSHDIFSVQLVGETLVSGGLTTDICCYPLHKNKQILQNFQNKISYRCQSVVHSMKNYLLINKLTSFQVWKICQNQADLQFLVRYQMPSQKFIKDIKISKRLGDKTHLIVASTQVDTIGWKFSQTEGLVKLFTIKNCYQFIEFLPGKSLFVGLRDTGDIEKVHCKTGKIDQILNSQIPLPTDMKLLSNEKLIVGSNLTNQIRVFDLKKKTLISKCSLTKIYQVICQKNESQFLIKYAEDRKLYACNFEKKLIQQSQILQLPENSRIIRYGGVIIHESQVTRNMKKYWYFANENKVFLVNNLNNPNKKKMVRSIYTRQIGTIVKPKVNKSFQLGVVHFNFRRMINNMEIKPLIAKKII